MSIYTNPCTPDDQNPNLSIYQSELKNVTHCIASFDIQAESPCKTLQVILPLTYAAYTKAIATKDIVLLRAIVRLVGSVLPWSKDVNGLWNRADNAGVNTLRPDLAGEINLWVAASEPVMFKVAAGIRGSVVIQPYHSDFVGVKKCTLTWAGAHFDADHIPCHQLSNLMPNAYNFFVAIMAKRLLPLELPAALDALRVFIRYTWSTLPWTFEPVIGAQPMPIFVHNNGVNVIRNGINNEFNLWVDSGKLIFQYKAGYR